MKIQRLHRYLHGRRVWWEHVRMARGKKHGGGRSPLLQALRLAECGFDITYRQYYCRHRMFPLGGAWWRYWPQQKPNRALRELYRRGLDIEQNGLPDRQDGEL